MLHNDLLSRSYSPNSCTEFVELPQPLIPRARGEGNSDRGIRVRLFQAVARFPHSTYVTGADTRGGGARRDTQDTGAAVWQRRRFPRRSIAAQPPVAHGGHGDSANADTGLGEGLAPVLPHTGPAASMRSGRRPSTRASTRAARRPTPRSRSAQSGAGPSRPCCAASSQAATPTASARSPPTSWPPFAQGPAVRR